MLPLVALVACNEPSDPRTPIDWGDEVTDTFPQFYGRVPKNLLMISMDTFRKDHFDALSDAQNAPFLASLAEDGVLVTDYTTCSNWTYASTSCTLAGRHNEEAGLLPKLSDQWARPWPVGTPFLARYLGDAGFYSILASTNGWLSPDWNNTDGYDMPYLPGTGLAWPLYLSARGRLEDAVADGRVEDSWFLHLHFVEPHSSYAPPDEYLEGLDDLDPVPWDLAERDVAYYQAKDAWPTMDAATQELLSEHLHVRYAGEISYMDDQFFSIFRDMMSRGLLDDTLVVFWTDHGEQFWEHGNQTHAYSLFREENDGLLWFWAPNIVPARWEEPVSAIDLVPTLVQLYGLPIDDRVTGIPIGEAPPDRPRYAGSIARLGGLNSVQKEGWKLTYAWTGGVRLFDLVNDPGEQDDLYDPTNPPAMAQELWADLEPMLDLAKPLAPEMWMILPAELEQ